MPSVEELQGSGVLAEVPVLPAAQGRLTFADHVWEEFKEKLNTLKTNHEKAGRWPNWFVPGMRDEFKKATHTYISDTYLYPFFKYVEPPKALNKEAPSYLVVAWVMALPADYLLPDRGKRAPVHHSVKIQAVPERPVAHSAFQAFVDAHCDEIQAPLIKAWKEITSFYNIEVVLESLRRMGFNDAAIAVLSKVAAK